MNRILIIDDNPAIQAIVTDILHRSLPGAEILRANDGFQGVEMADQYLPDLIIIDGSMPFMDGVNTIYRLRDNSRTASIPLIGMTAESDESALFKNLRSNCVRLLPKPFAVEALIESIAAIECVSA